MPNNAELLDVIALKRVQASLDTALAALNRDPKQITNQYETDKLSFDWRQNETAIASAQLNQQFVAKAYVRAEMDSAGKQSAESDLPKSSFNTSG